ncbi:WD_REPEATS_REGION domain-containing protein, partial [Durusdinium trenchii]
MPIPNIRGKAGFDVRTSDLTKGPLHDLTTSEGFLLALKQVLRVRYDGLYWLGVPCNSWVWIASSTTKRHSSEFGILGDDRIPSVSMGNCISARCALLIMVAIVRGIYWCAEQPGSSVLKDSPYISHVLTSMGPHYLKRMSMGAYGHWCIKPSQLFGSWPNVETFTAKVSKDLREHLSKASKGMYKKEVLPDGRVR